MSWGGIWSLLFDEAWQTSAWAVWTAQGWGCADMSTDGEENRLGYGSPERESIMVCFTCYGKAYNKLCSLWFAQPLSQSSNALASFQCSSKNNNLNELVSVAPVPWKVLLGKEITYVSWCPASVPAPDDAPAQWCLRELCSSETKLPPLFSSQRAAAELNPKLLLIFAAARCEQLKTVCRYYI